MDDLGKLQDKNIALDGRVLLVRSGKISFAEKVRELHKKKQKQKKTYFLEIFHKHTAEFLIRSLISSFEGLVSV